MSERYSKLLSLPENLYAEGSPVIISAGNLLKDTQTGKVLAQLKIKNICCKTIKAATVIIHALDTTGKPLDADATQEYLDLSVAQGTEFGQKVAILLPNPSTRGFTVSVYRVVFTDNSAWEGTDVPWNPLPAPKSLSRTLGDAELVKQYRLTFGVPCEIAPQTHKDLWLCACGTWNKDWKCYRCGKEKAALMGLDLVSLMAEKDTRLAQEKADREAKEATQKAEAEARAKKTKKILTILISAVLVCVAAFLLVTKVFIPNSNYKKAMALYDAGQYEDAIVTFEAMDGYKDSAAQIEACETAIKDQKYNAAMALYSAGNYEGAITAFTALNDYKDSAAQIATIKDQKYDAAM